MIPEWIEEYSFIADLVVIGGPVVTTALNDVFGVVGEVSETSSEDLDFGGSVVAGLISKYYLT